MKTTIVPAQITTVEDKIAGNLSLQQMILLALPVFVDFSLYAVLPHPLRLNTYKLALMMLASIVFGLLAIRVKGQILLSWAMTILRYNGRPQFIVFNKNDDYLRTPELPPELTAEVPKTEARKAAASSSPLTLSQEEIMKLEGIMANPKAHLSFKLQKGGLCVSVTEIQ